MTAQNGKDLLLKIGDGGDPESFASVAGLRAKTITLNARTVDATNADSPGAWRELLSGAGVKSCAVSGSGIFVDRHQRFRVLPGDRCQILVVQHV